MPTNTPVFQPSREADLLAWSVNFSAKITATPTAYGLTSVQAGLMIRRPCTRAVQASARNS